MKKHKTAHRAADSVDHNDNPAPYKTRNDLPVKQRVEVNTLLNARLSDAVDLQMQMKQAHWNVKGPHFIGLHTLFDQVAGAVEGHVDLIAERIVQLGGIAEGTVRTAATRTRLGEYPLTISEGIAHIDAASTALAAFAHEVRHSIDTAETLGDAGTADLLTDVSRSFDKWLWFVEAHAQASK